MVKKLLLSMALIKPGTLYSEKSPQPTKNARLTVLVFICHFLKMFNKFSYPLTLKKKDGTLFLLNGTIWSSVDWRDSSTLMLMERNGFRLMLELLGRSWKCLKKRVVFLKSRKLKEMGNPTLKSTWTRKHLEQRGNTQSESSFSTYKFTNQQRISKEGMPTLANIWK